MTFKELRALTGLSQAQFSSRLEVPLRTYQSWEASDETPTSRKPAGYILKMAEKCMLGVNRYEHNEEYYIEIHYNYESKIFESWLCREGYGVKIYMFGYPCSLKKMINMAKESASDYIHEFDEYE